MCDFWGFLDLNAFSENFYQIKCIVHEESRITFNMPFKLFEYTNLFLRYDTKRIIQ